MLNEEEESLVVMCELSVIVPVYKAEEFLTKCVDSILAQTEKNLELILVDDGSPDDSGRICDDYAQRDERVKVVHKKNEGVSVARNTGIDLARGAYIGFVDSDDWIEPEMFEKLLTEAKITNSDIVMCDATTVYSNGKRQADTITQLSGNTILKKSDFSPALLLEMAGSAWRCIYRHNDKLTKSTRLRFPLGVKFSEDRIFNLYAMGRANKVSYLKESYYNRYMNVKSAVHRFHEDYFEAQKKSATGIEQAIKDAWENDEALQKAYLGQLIGGALGAICNYYYKTSTFKAKERKAKIRMLCEDQQLRHAIDVYGAGRKSKWILDRRYGLLIMYARFANLKHGR